MSTDINYGPEVQLSRTLVVRQASQTIQWDSKPEVLLSAKTLTLTALSSSQLPVRFEVEPSNLVRLEGNTLHLLQAGRIKITAMQDGNTNFRAAEPVTYYMDNIRSTLENSIRVHPAISPRLVIIINPMSLKG